MKTGTHPFISKLKLFTKWGIEFDAKPYTVSDKGSRKVSYTSKEVIENAIGGVKSFVKSTSGGAIMSEQNEMQNEQRLSRQNKLRTGNV